MIPGSSKSRYLHQFLAAPEGTHTLLRRENSLAPQCNTKIGQGLREGNCRLLSLNTPSWSFLLLDPIQLTSREHTTRLIYAYIISSRLSSTVMLVSMKTTGKNQGSCSTAPVQSSDVLQRCKLRAAPMPFS